MTDVAKVICSVLHSQARQLWWWVNGDVPCYIACTQAQHVALFLHMSYIQWQLQNLFIFYFLENSLKKLKYINITKKKKEKWRVLERFLFWSIYLPSSHGTDYENVGLLEDWNLEETLIFFVEFGGDIIFYPVIHYFIILLFFWVVDPINVLESEFVNAIR